MARTLSYLGFEVHGLVRPHSTQDLLKDVVYIPHLFNGDSKSIIALFERQAFDVIFHTAAYSVYEPKWEEVDLLLASNVLLGTYILEAIKQTRPCYFINVGSYWQHAYSLDYSPLCLYAATKQAFEDILEYYVQSGFVKAVTVKLFDVYGPADPRMKIFNLLWKTHLNKIPLKMGMGEKYHDFIYIDDVVNGLVQAYRYLMGMGSEEHSRFFLGTERLIQLKEAVKIYEKTLGDSLPVEWNVLPARRADMVKPACGKRVPAWKAKVTLEEGLKKLVESQKKLILSVI